MGLLPTLNMLHLVCPQDRYALQSGRCCHSPAPSNDLLHNFNNQPKDRRFCELTLQEDVTKNGKALGTSLNTANTSTTRLNTLESDIFYRNPPLFSLHAKFDSRRCSYGSLGQVAWYSPSIGGLNVFSTWDEHVEMGGGSLAEVD